jgi:transcriptional regulator with XRE-family HTH domain
MEMSPDIIKEGKMNERIKELRKFLGLTLEKFGERLGVGKTAISKIEKGDRNVTDQMFVSICREFKVNEDWLRDGTGEMFKVPEDETAAIVSTLLEESDDNEFYKMAVKLVGQYNQLSPEDQNVIDRLCERLLSGQG